MEGPHGSSQKSASPPSAPSVSPSSNAAGSESASSGQVRPGTSGGTGRRRKVPDSVTPNACTNCKKARAKCDGVKPACRRCVHRNTRDSCYYEMHAKTAKEQIIREIQRLQRKNEHLEQENDSLGERNEHLEQETDMLGRKNSWIEQIIRSLQNDGQGNEIINRLKRGESHQSIAESLGRPLIGKSNAPVSPTTEHKISQAIHQYHRDLVENHHPCYWTNVTHDSQLIEHLISLFFTWIHPVHMVLDERHFMSSFRDCSDLYCSPALVSIICAMSCHLLYDIDVDDDQTKDAVDSLRSRFVEESRALMKTADYHKMTTVQTYVIMFLAEFGSGHGLMATSHLRLAVEVLIEKQNSDQSQEAEEVGAWGILTLHTAWSGFIYQKPQAPISTRALPFPADIFGAGESKGTWRLYKQPGDSDASNRSSLSVMTASEHAKLFRIVHESILVYCGSRGKVSAQHLLEIYERYMAWKDGLPHALRELDNDPLPHVLFLHIQYHTALVQLLQPILHVDNMSRDSYDLLQGLIIQHAHAGLRLLHQYRSAYSYSYLSPLQLVCMVLLCDTAVRYDAVGEATPQVIHFCLTSLQDAKRGYPVAGPLQKMFRNSLSEYNLPVPDELERLIGPSTRISPEELLDAFTRPTYKQPITQIMPNMEPDLATDFITSWQDVFSEGRASKDLSRENGRSGTGSGKGKKTDIGSILNP